MSSSHEDIKKIRKGESGVNRVICSLSAMFIPDQIRQFPCEKKPVNDLTEFLTNNGLTLQQV